MKRILDTLQENHFLPGNCPILQPEEAQENGILKKKIIFFAVSLKSVTTMNTAVDENSLD